MSFTAFSDGNAFRDAMQGNKEHIVPNGRLRMAINIVYCFYQNNDVAR
jgi:hypothetical protein